MNRRLIRPIAIAGSALALGLGAAACGDDGETQTPPKAPAAEAGQGNGAVNIKTFMFQPDPVRVKAGTTVTWTNQDDILHTVTAGARGKPSKEFDEKLKLNGEFSHTFDEAGTHPYVCTIHKGMDGTVIVS